MRITAWLCWPHLRLHDLQVSSIGTYCRRCGRLV